MNPNLAMPNAMSANGAYANGMNGFSNGSYGSDVADIKNENYYLNQFDINSSQMDPNQTALQERLKLKKKLQRNRTSFSQHQIDILENGEFNLFFIYAFSL